MPITTFNPVLTSMSTLALRVLGPAMSRFVRPVEIDGKRLDPAVQLLLLGLERVESAGPHSQSVGKRRAAVRRSAILGTPRPSGVDVHDSTLPGTDSTLATRLYRSRALGSAEVATIVYFHGGGWVVGDLDTHDAICRLIAVASDCNVVAVDYRLAPEHPFPAAADDAISAFRWLRDETFAGAIPGAVAVMGDSAGGNLAAVVAQQSALSGERAPLAQGLLYPGLDVRLETESVTKYATGFLLTRDDLEWFRSHYAPAPRDWVNPRVSPGLADDVSGLCPTWMWTAGFDPLLDEDDAYADRLREAGVRVHYRCYPDQVHGFASMGVVPGGVDRILQIGREMGELIRDALTADVTFQ